MLMQNISHYKHCIEDCTEKGKYDFLVKVIDC